MGMRMLWSLQYKGSNPAIGLRKVEHVLGLRPSGFGSRPFVHKSHYIQFFCALKADTWESAVVEALDLASRYSQVWTVRMLPGRLHAGTDVRTVAEAIHLSFELNAAQYFQTEVGFVSLNR
jgi:hypothetical protein